MSFPDVTSVNVGNIVFWSMKVLELLESCYISEKYSASVFRIEVSWRWAKYVLPKCLQISTNYKAL
jgi:hypothetical protein